MTTQTPDRDVTGSLRMGVAVAVEEDVPVRSLNESQLLRRVAILHLAKMRADLRWRRRHRKARTLRRLGWVR